MTNLILISFLIIFILLIIYYVYYHLPPLSGKEGYSSYKVIWDQQTGTINGKGPYSIPNMSRCKLSNDSIIFDDRLIMPRMKSVYNYSSRIFPYALANQLN
jgi:hypothetical protein